MMFVLRKICCIALAVALLLFATGAYGSSENNEPFYIASTRYDTAINQLENWLELIGQPVEKLEQIIDVFDGLENYEMSRAFGYYKKVLMKTVNHEFDYNYTFWSEMLLENTEFQEYLINTIKSKHIGTVENLLNYAKGMEAELQGNYELAASCYIKCLNYYDASKRYENTGGTENRQWYEQGLELMEKGDLVEALQAFEKANGYSDSFDIIEYIKNSNNTNVESVMKGKDVLSFSVTYPGQNIKLRTNSDDNYRVQAYTGPGKQYETGGAYKPKKQKNITAFFVENDYVFIELSYQTVANRYLYVQKSAFNADQNLPELTDMEFINGTTNKTLIPLWGPGDQYQENKDFAVLEGTSVHILFQHNNYVYAEYQSTSGLVRMWLPMDDIRLSEQ